MLALFNRARNKRANGEDGFTLIELLVVVVILGILIAIAIPVYLNYKKSAADKAAQSDVRNAIGVFEQCNSDGSYPSGYTNSTNVLAGCGTTTVTSLSKSDNTTLTYFLKSTSDAYIIEGKNSGGSTLYCYSSAAGGAVKSTSSALVTAYAATC